MLDLDEAVWMRDRTMALDQFISEYFLHEEPEPCRHPLRLPSGRGGWRCTDCGTELGDGKGEDDTD